MTGVGSTPRSFEGFVSDVKRRLIALERRSQSGQSAGSTVVANWNDATATGFYQSSNGGNAPSSGDFVGTVIAHANGYVRQHAANTFLANRGFVRNFNGTSWTAWEPL